MTTAVRYHSRGGKTKKLADAVANAVCTVARPVSEQIETDVDILFLCTAPYAFDVDDEVKSFIRGINASVKMAVLISSSAVLKSIRKYVDKLFIEKHISLSNEEFSCRGEFMIFHKGRPNSEDLKDVTNFAKRIVSQRNSN